METRLDAYKGRVLTWREDNGYNDSDFLALVQEDDGSFGWIEYASTRYYGGCFAAKPDATDEVLAAYRVFRDGLVAKATASRIERDALSAKIGSPVKITRSRKYKGETGTIKWWGLDQYKSNRRTKAYRVGVVLDSTGEMVFVPAGYLQVEVDGKWTQIVNHSESQMSPLGNRTAEEWIVSQYPHPDRMRK